jgi:hypothetical protein
MRFMNDYDIQKALARWGEHPVVGAAIRQIEILRDYADGNSDGWAYWPKPARAGARLMELVERDGTSKYRFDTVRADATLAELRKALVPVKAFRTRELAAGRPGFEVVEVRGSKRVEYLQRNEGLWYAEDDEGRLGPFPSAAEARRYYEATEA